MHHPAPTKCSQAFRVWLDMCADRFGCGGSGHSGYGRRTASRIGWNCWWGWRNVTARWGIAPNEGANLWRWFRDDFKTGRRLWKEKQKSIGKCHIMSTAWEMLLYRRIHSVFMPPTVLSQRVMPWVSRVSNGKFRSPATLRKLVNPVNNVHYLS